MLCPSHRAIFEELERLAPGAPFLALGQTAFWDEPMKAGVALCSRALGYGRPFLAGVHDTDYFAKHGGASKTGGYVALPHNDTTTRDLWSAAGEFSALFGSETVITRENFLRARAKLGKIQRERPGHLDKMTEAWGWRGVVFQGDQTPVIAETPFAPLQEALLRTLDWAMDATLELLPECQREAAEAKAAELRSLACDATDAAANDSLGRYYQEVLPKLYDFAAGQPVGVGATRSTELLRFNRETAGLKRFALVDLFLRPETREIATRAYNDTLRGSEIYTLDRFGSWAIPFDLVVPGKGRGTLRIAPKAVIIMTPTPLFITTKTPVRSVADLAEAIERKFGPNCTLVGKAVTLIGMLATEHVFVFHEGASGYVHHSRSFHQRLGDLAPHLNPILRVKYASWDALEECHRWLRLPDPLKQPFGAEELTTKSFAARWRKAVEEQTQLLRDLEALQRPIDFVRFLAQKFSQTWSEPAARYEAMHAQLQALNQAIEGVRVEKRVAMQALRLAKQLRNQLQHEKGRHFRAAIFERTATQKDLAKRQQFDEELRRLDKQISDAKQAWRELEAKQQALVQAPEVRRTHEARRDLELELELKRLRLVRQAITVSKGLVKAGYRPSSWWFPLLCPDGGWFQKTVDEAEYYLEPLR